MIKTKIKLCNILKTVCTEISTLRKNVSFLVIFLKPTMESTDFYYGKKRKKWTKKNKQITKQYTTEYLNAIVLDMHIRIQQNIDCIVVCMHVHVCIFPGKMINMIFIFVI